MLFRSLQKKLREEHAKTRLAEAILTQEAAIAKARADKLANELKARKLEISLRDAALQSEIASLELRKQYESYSPAKPVYIGNPLRKDGTLVISDRRILLNGPITYRLADYVTERIHYYNNKDSKFPIFIVIDTSPGGSVMAGYRILKAMESSSAPVHVVVKSFAASMAATIATLAEKSYAYPNAILLHHQLSLTVFGSFNLTEQKELAEESQRWWKRLAEPLARKMGITPEAFVKKMYEKSSSGDWTEFADGAKKLKWITHVVRRVRETSVVRDPGSKSSSPSSCGVILDASGRSVRYLPRLSPRDFYFLYNPDKYYRIR